MRYGAAYLLVFLVVSSASVSLPMVYAQPRVGEILLNPTHALPGVLVRFQGVGWCLPVPWGYEGMGRYVVCQVNGEPVKIDRHCICNVISGRGGGPEGEPVGTFVVANVPAGDYSIFVDIEPSPAGAWLTGEAMFTVDPVATATNVATATLATSVTSHTPTLTTSQITMTPTSTSMVPITVTVTAKESAPIDFALFSMALSIVAISVVVILAVVLLRERGKSGKTVSDKSNDSK